MEALRRDGGFFLFLLFLSSLFVLSISALFSPTDNYLLDCGSSVDSTIDNRRFTSDSSTSNSHLLSSARSVSLAMESPPLGLPPIYRTARIFKAPSKYVFEVKDPGTHMFRFHFHRFNSSKIDLGNAQFHVLVNGFVVLSNFGGQKLVNPMIIENWMWADVGKLVITFVPATRSNFAFVNAIEVISAPKDLILDTAQFVSDHKIEKLGGMTEQALEVLYRINVGGAKVTPFNDSLWRTWLPDNEYFKSVDGSNKVYYGGRIRYQPGGASREVGPDNVYNTARVLNSKNASIPNVNLTWEFPVVEGYRYLVRMHFCDVASISLGLLYFNVYVNGHLAYQDVDMSDITSYTLASPFYADFVVNGDPSGILSVSVGPSNSSMANTADAILNGVEIMKMNKSRSSFDGQFSAELVLRCWHKGNSSIMVPLIAVVCLLLIMSMVTHKKPSGTIDSVPWTRLSTDVPESFTKNNKVEFSAKS